VAEKANQLNIPMRGYVSCVMVRCHLSSMLWETVQGQPFDVLTGAMNFLKGLPLSRSREGISRGMGDRKATRVRMS
jgi:hypothetical protein